jgi:excisionase family DNA binding protein
LTGRDRLLAVLAPDLVEAIEQLVEERVREQLEAAGTPSTSSPWLSLEEAGDYLRVSTRSLERRIAKRRIRSTTVGRRRLLHRDDLDEFAKAATREDVTPATPPRRRAQTLDLSREEA